jgi:hypothetical protein
MTGSSNNTSVDRRLFIGGSDARFIMSADEAALILRRRSIWLAPAQHVGDQRPISGALHYHRRWQMD